MKSYEDSNRDCHDGKGDELIAKGRLSKDFRETDIQLAAFEFLKFKQGLRRLETELDPVGFGVKPTLEFKNSDSNLVGRMNFV